MVSIWTRAIVELFFNATFSTTPRSTGSSMKALWLLASCQLHTAIFASPSILTFTVVICNFICKEICDDYTVNWYLNKFYENTIYLIDAFLDLFYLCKFHEHTVCNAHTHLSRYHKALLHILYHIDK